MGIETATLVAIGSAVVGAGTAVYQTQAQASQAKKQRSALAAQTAAVEKDAQTDKSAFSSQKGATQDERRAAARRKGRTSTLATGTQGIQSSLLATKTPVLG